MSSSRANGDAWNCSSCTLSRNAVAHLKHSSQTRFHRSVETGSSFDWGRLVTQLLTVVASFDAALGKWGNFTTTAATVKPDPNGGRPGVTASYRTFPRSLSRYTSIKVGALQDCVVKDLVHVVIERQPRLKTKWRSAAICLQTWRKNRLIFRYGQ